MLKSFVFGFTFLSFLPSLFPCSGSQLSALRKHKIMVLSKENGHVHEELPFHFRVVFTAYSRHTPVSGGVPNVSHPQITCLVIFLGPEAKIISKRFT
jgi:hypothetical protein